MNDDELESTNWRARHPILANVFYFALWTVFTLGLYSIISWWVFR